MSKYLFSPLPEYRTETSHKKGYSWTLQKCSLCPFNLFRSPWQDETGRRQAKIPDIFPQKTWLLWMIFPIYFVRPLSKGIYEGAHPKESSLKLRTEKAQKVAKPVEFERALGRCCEFGIP